ncbi:MAG: DUF6288 domain-containing protein, partial [Phycisphaeraceae bacterium]|nr:DUF6288 domain-containing protein [Phycisphaeraceae bacterium]
MIRSTSWHALWILIVALAFAAPAEARRGKNIHQSPPDLTAGGEPDDTRDWRLGPLGANGWVFNRNSRRGASREARQILITRVDEDGPAHGQLKVGDVIVGIDDKPFDRDARIMLADAINEAEKEANAGELTLSVFRDGKTTPVTVELPVMGSFSPTAPYECPKTDRIIDQAVE